MADLLTPRRYTGHRANRNADEHEFDFSPTASRHAPPRLGTRDRMQNRGPARILPP